MPKQFEPLGDEAYLFYGVDAAWASGARDFFGVKDATVVYGTGGLYIDPSRFKLSEFLEASKHFATKKHKAVRHDFRVDFSQGLDWEIICELCSISQNQAIEMLCSTDFLVEAIGFQPGFPYMSGLPEPLSKVPRLSKPRNEVPMGAVAIAAGQTGIYPLSSPGGWNIVGVTPACIAKQEEKWFLLKVGDKVRFFAE